MKNSVFCIVLFTSFLILFACAGTPPAPVSSPTEAVSSPPESPPTETPPLPETPPTAPTPVSVPPTTPTPVPPTAPPSPPSVTAPPERAHDLILDGAETYTVVRKDTLSRIARIKYHNGFYYPLIIMASRDIVEDQDYIEVGTLLTVPNLQANLNDARARASMKKFFLEIADITERQYKRPKDAAGLRKLANSL